MKFFTKIAIAGTPKTDIERVMTHYKVSRDEAVAKIKAQGVEKLLPPRSFSNRR